MTEFMAHVQKSRRIVIPGGVYKAMDLKDGDEVLVNVTKKASNGPLDKLENMEHGQV